MKKTIFRVALLLTCSISAFAQSSLVARPNADVQMTADKRLVSPNGQFTLVLQGDGNAVIYKSSCIGKVECHIWQSGTAGKSTNPLLVMQGDGNFVIYDGSQTAGKDIYSIGPSGQSTYLLLLQDEGNLVVYTSERAVWSTLTGKISNEPKPQDCGGNDLQKLACDINKAATRSGFGAILDGSRYLVKNTKSGVCTNLGKRFPGGDIGLLAVKAEYPSDKDYSVEQGDCK